MQALCSQVKGFPISSFETFFDIYKLILFRFYNMILLSGLKQKKLWIIIKKFRLKYLIENVKKINTRGCSFVDTEGNVIQSKDVDAQMVMDSVEKELKNLGSKHNNHDMMATHNFETELYEMAGKMFLYLNLCPKFMYEWVQLYVDLFKNATPYVIVQTLNRIMVTGKQKKDKTVTNIARKIFNRIDNKLSLKYKTIDIFLKTNKNITLDKMDNYSRKLRNTSTTSNIYLSKSEKG